MKWERFCLGEAGPHTGDFLLKPWVYQGWRYASDGRIAVREPCKEPDSVDLRTGVVKLVAGYFGPSPTSDEIAALPIVPKADGEADEYGEPACWDDGKCPHQDTCDPDAGDCDHVVYIRTAKPQKFAGHWWGGYQIELLNEELPGARFKIAFVPRVDYQCMYFYCGQVEGVLARLKKK